MIGRLRDLIFGYDIFISYDFDEAGAYATQLKACLDRLETPLRCFLDREGFHPGDELNAVSRRRLRSSRHLVAIITPGAGDAKSWVPHEMEIFTRGGTRNSDRIVPLNVAHSLERFPPDAKVLRFVPVSAGPHAGDSVLYHPVTAEEFASGPSAFTLARVRELVGTRRVDRRRLRFFQAVSAVMLCLFLAAGAMALLVDRQRSRLAYVASEAAFRSAAAWLDAGDVGGAVSSLATSLEADAGNASAADRLLSLLVQRATPWLALDTQATASNIVASAVTDDARRFAVALEDGTISLGTWQSPLATLPHDGCGAAGKSAAVRLRFTPNGQMLATLRMDGSLCVYDVAARRLVKRQDRLGQPAALALSADSRLAAVGREDGSVLVLPLQEGPQQELPVPAGQPADRKDGEARMEALQFIGGNRLLVSLRDRALIWDPVKGAADELFENEELSGDPPTAESFNSISPDGAWYARLRIDQGNFQATQLPLNKIIIAATRKGADADEAPWSGQREDLETIEVQDTSFDPTSSRFAMALNNGTVKILSRHGEPVSIEHFGVGGVGSDQTGQTLYTVTDREMRLWSVVDGRPIGDPLPTAGRPFTLGDRRLVVVAGNRSMTLWAAADPVGMAPATATQRSVPHPQTKLARDGRRQLNEKGAGTWVIDDGAGASALPAIEFPLSDEAQRIEERKNEEFTRDSFFRTTEAAISADGTTVVTIAAERPPAVWKVGDSARTRDLGEADEDMIAERVYVSRSGTRALVLYSSEPRRQLPASYRVFDLVNGEQLVQETINPRETVEGVTHDGARIAFGSGRTITIRDAVSRQVVGLPAQEAGPICGIAFSADDRSYATRTADGSIRLRETESGLPLSDAVALDRSAMGENLCSAHLWFSEADRRINIEPKRTSTVDVSRQSWQSRFVLTPEQRRELAAFARLYHNVQLSGVATEEPARRSAAAVRRQLEKIGSRDLSEALGPVLSLPTFP